MTTAGRQLAEKPRIRVRAQIGRPTGPNSFELRRQDPSAARMVSASTSFAGASTIMSELASWIARGGDADAALREVAQLRRRSYDLHRNHPIVSGAVATHRSETIGTGLRLQSRVNAKALGLEPEQASEVEEQLERAFRAWAEDPRECDLEGTKTFYDMQDLNVVTELLAGDAFALLVQRQRVGSPWTSRIQLVDPARAENPHGRQATSRLAGGVERDGDGFVVGYHFREGHPETSKIDKVNLEWRRFRRYAASGRQQVFHVMQADMNDQSRGYPQLAPVIHKLKQMDRYADAEIMAAVVGGFLSVIFHEERDGGAPNWDEGSDVQEAAEAAGIDGDDVLAMGHGTMMTAPAGMVPKVVSPGRPNAEFDPFVTSVLRQIGISLELPFEVLIGHFQSSYSAARAALLKAWKATLVRRERHARHFCTPVYRSWLYEAAAKGVVDLPGFFDDPFARAAWSGCAWVGPARGAIDPQREYGAEIDLIDAGLRSRDDASKLLTGNDWDDTAQRLAREAKVLAELGIATTSSNTPSQAVLFPDTADSTET